MSFLSCHHQVWTKFNSDTWPTSWKALFVSYDGYWLWNPQGANNEDNPVVVVAKGAGSSTDAGSSGLHYISLHLQ